MKKTYYTEVVIVGGGLAGILAALRLSKANVRCILLDDCIPAANGRLGGFAAFSGAKFSLPPAGMGLVPLVGSAEMLGAKISEVIECLGIGASHSVASFEEGISGQFGLDRSTTLRRYHSILLTPNEMSDLLEVLTKRIEKECSLIRGTCHSFSKSGGGWQVIAHTGNQSEAIHIASGTVFFAGGRLSELLINAGATPSPGKGLDIGVRIEALNMSALSGLRALGPDAKIIRGNCRTFCLNVPGLIYHYPFKNLSIPGGIVADTSVSRGNVGLLVRVSEKYERLQQMLKATEKRSKQFMNDDAIIMSSAPFGQMEEKVSKVIGVDVVQQLQDFCKTLGDLDLIDWSLPYKIHLPLLDWHWQTFARAASHKTSLEGVYVLGDSSGHARGLLQAAVGGWIAAEEYLQ